MEKEKRNEFPYDLMDDEEDMGNVTTELQPITVGKIYILDTNILIDDANAIFKFEENTVCITDTTLEELDGLKNAAGETGYSARKAIRQISKLREQGDYITGIKLPNGGVFRIIQNQNRLESAKNGFNTMKADNRILDTVLMAINSAGDHKVILVTNDIAMQVKASVCGITVQDYKNRKVEGTGYTGRRKVVLPDEQYELVLQYYESKTTEVTEAQIEEMSNVETPFVVNEYISLCCGNLSVQVRVGADGYLHKMEEKNLHPCDITPRNMGQKCALDALMNPLIPLVLLIGPAGSAKTFLALAAGLDGVLEGKYSKVLITRTNVLADADIGFLPGTLEDKMSPLLAPYFDNLATILRGKNGKEESREQIQIQIEDMLADGTIEIASMAYMRGRSLTDTFVIIDEVQNASQVQALTIVSRLGEGSKLVMCGDLGQIDAPYLSRENNGLSFTSDRMRGSELCAQVTFTNEESVRSPLAYEAAIRMAI